MIEARDVVVQGRAGKRLLDGVSVNLRSGTVTAILGPNGAGKTTLLRVLAGLLRPDHGGILFDGVTLAAIGGSALARRRAVLGQQQQLESALPVADVVALGRLPHAGTPAAAADPAAIAASRESFALGPFWRRDYPSLSGGERQRVHLARVAAQLWRGPGGVGPTRALFLDEPTAALDLAQQKLALDAARRAADDGVIVVQILHDLNQAARADQAVMLRGGRVLAAGPVAAVLQPQILQSAFGVTVEPVRRADGTLGYLA